MRLGDIPGVPGGNGADQQCHRCLTTLVADAEIFHLGVLELLFLLKLDL